MRTLWVLVLCAAASAAPAANKTRKPEPVEARIARIEEGLLPRVLVEGALSPEQRLVDRMAHHRVPGVSVAVVEDGAVQWSRAYGFADLSTSRRMTPATRLQVGELSTLVSAYTALALVRARKLTLDGDVNRWLAAWKVPEQPRTAERKVTLRRLLSHSAGFGVEWFEGYDATLAIPTLDEVLTGTAPATNPPLELEYVPGLRTAYSAGGYVVVQRLVSDVARAPFSQVARKLVLGPLAMNASGFEQPPPARVLKALATGYSAGEPVPGGWRVYPEEAATGLWTTAEDLARFIIEVQRARKGRSRIVDESLARDYLLPGFTELGLGPRITGKGLAVRFSQAGVAAGFEALLVGYAHEGQGAVVLTNAEGGLPLAQELMLAIAREYRWQDYAPRRALAVAPELLDSFAGRYLLEAEARGDHTLPALECVASVQEGRLFWEPKGLGRRELYAEGKDRFFALDGAPGVTFERDATGRVTHAVIRGGAIERRAKRL